MAPLTEEEWIDTRQEILKDLAMRELFVDAAKSIGVIPPPEINDWIRGMNILTAESILIEMTNIDVEESSRVELDAQDVERRLLALSSPLLGTLAVALALLGLALLITG